MSSTKPTPTGRAADPDEVDAATPLPATVETVDTVDDDLDLGEDEDLDTTVSNGPGVLARIGVEVVGTFALVLVTLGVVLYAPLTQLGTVGMALGAGLVLAGTTAALGHVSGGHFNPAVTLGSVLAGRTAAGDLLLYWLAQVIGGAAAAALLFVTVPDALPSLVGAQGVPEFVALTANGWGEGAPLWLQSGGQATFGLPAALAIETLCTAVLVAVVLGSAHRRASRATAPIAIGLTYAALLMVAAPITGGSLNPARSTAAALFVGGLALKQVWLFWLAPLLGAAVVGVIHLAFVPSVPDGARLAEEEALLAAEADAEETGPVAR